MPCALVPWNNIFKHKQAFNLTKHLLHISIEPTYINQALKDPKWRYAMLESSRHYKTKEFDLVHSFSLQNVIGSYWVLRIERNPDGLILKYKACLVAKACRQ